MGIIKAFVLAAIPTAGALLFIGPGYLETIELVARYESFPQVPKEIFSPTGEIRLAPMSTYYGDDSGSGALNGRCNDVQFENHPESTGGGMGFFLLNDDIQGDATDCRELYDRGRIRLR